MADWETLYAHLPVGAQHVACSVEGWRIQRSRFGPGFTRALRQAEERAKWTEERVAQYRDRRIRLFIRRAAATVPFYRRRFAEARVSPSDINSLEDLKKLPLLQKAAVQDHHPGLLSSSISPGERVMTHTSGTSGGGLRFATTLHAQQEQWASWWRYRRWHGLSLGTWCAYFGGRSVVPIRRERPPFWRYDLPGRQVIFSAHHASPESLPLYLEELRSRHPPWIHGYPSVIALVAGSIIDTGFDLGYSVRWITTGAENLLPHQTEVIERAFGVRPRQHYGMAEAVANASECELGTLHIDEDFAAVELISSDGGGYRIVGTNLSNPAVPLIRYDTQDVGRFTERTCRCGRAGRVIDAVDGREEDYVVLGNGARIGRMDHAFKDLVTIREAQIHQRRPGELTVRVVRAAGYTSKDEARLIAEMRKRVGDAGISIEYRDRLDRGPSGKLRLVVSDIEIGRIRDR